MTRDRSKRARRDRFADAVLAFAAEPTPANVVRYLIASRALEDEPRRRRQRLATHALVEREHKTATA
jgi:hypothetical protein